MKQKPPKVLRVIIVSFLIAVLLYSCYTEQKARQQFSKAAIAYPKLPAEYCATTYPVKDSLITDTLLTTDTLYVEGPAGDTIMVQDFDTVRIYITKTLPAKIITNTIYIRDTILRENTAKLAACDIDKSIALGLLKKKTSESDEWERKAHKRGLIMWSTFGLIFLILGLYFYLKSKTHGITAKV